MVVQECLSREKVLTTERERVFSRGAHAYVYAYYKMWLDQQAQEENTTNQVASSNSDYTPVNIEKMVKQFETHRCALDFDHSFCKAAYIDLMHKQ